MYTVNIEGDEKHVQTAKRHGIHAYHASGTCAVETNEKTRPHAIRRVRDIFGRSVKIYHVYV